MKIGLSMLTSTMSETVHYIAKAPHRLNLSLDFEKAAENGTCKQQERCHTKPAQDSAADDEPKTVVCRDRDLKL